MRRSRTRLLGGAAALALGLVIYTVSFDADGYLHAARNARLERVIKAASRDVSPPRPLRARYHRGAPPCFNDTAAELSDEEARAMVDELSAAGMLPVVGEALSLLATWLVDDEHARHGEASDSEVRDSIAFTTGDGLGSRVIRALHGPGLMAAARKHEIELREANGRKRALLERALVQSQRDALRSIWMRRHDVLRIAGLVKVSKEAARRTGR